MNKNRKLSPKATLLLDSTQSERIEYIKKGIFITYPKADEILNEMEDLLNHPKVNRMPNILIVGRSNNGKTEILQEFLKRHPAHDAPNKDTIQAPVVYIQAPPGPSEHIFLNSLLQTLWAQFNVNESADRKLEHVIDILSQINVQVLMIDEINALLAGSATKQRYFLNMLKYIGNRLQISIVGAGTQEARLALATDEQLKSRFPVRTLPRWQWGDDFRRLLASFEYVLPLKQASNLTDVMIAKKLYGLSGGTLGQLATIIRSASETAINTGRECINEDILNQCKAVLHEVNNNLDEI